MSGPFLHGRVASRRFRLRSGPVAFAVAGLCAAGPATEAAELFGPSGVLYTNTFLVPGTKIESVVGVADVSGDGNADLAPCHGRRHAGGQPFRTE